MPGNLKTPYQSTEQQPHEKTHLSMFSTYLREIIYGGSDGIITTFAVVAGFSGAEIQGTTLPILSVLLFGCANLFADATSMGLGNYLSVRADQDVYAREKARLLTAIKSHNTTIQTRTIALLDIHGYSKADAETMCELFQKNHNDWADFIMRNELDLTDAFSEKPFVTSLATFAAFIVFGAIPLIPYVVFEKMPQEQFVFSLLFTYTALILLGLFRWKVTHRHLLVSLGETLLIGTLSAIVAYSIGLLFHIG